MLKYKKTPKRLLTLDGLISILSQRLNNNVKDQESQKAENTWIKGHANGLGVGHMDV